MKNKMFYCTKCSMPNTRPGITFDRDGVCAACNAYAKRQDTDYKKRFAELQTLCDKYRNCNGAGEYDCMIAVSDFNFNSFGVPIKPLVKAGDTTGSASSQIFP